VSCPTSNLSRKRDSGSARNAGQARQNLAAAELEPSAECVRKLSACTDQIKKHIGANADMWESGDRSRIR